MFYDNLCVMKPSCLDDYEILQIIGEGSFGKVYKASKYNKINQSNEFFAIKHISVPKNRTEIDSIKLSLTNIGNKESDAIEQEVKLQIKNRANSFLNEITIMNDLVKNSGYNYVVKIEQSTIIENPNTVGYEIFIIMELLISLDRYIIENPTTYHQTLDIVQMGIDICSALEQCEKINITHRDIKPSNIFVNRDANNTILGYKLGDFGTARRTEEAQLTMTRDVGTIEFMSPQQQRGVVNSTNDTYSLGLVMYKLLNGFRSPFYPLPPKGFNNSDIQKARECLNSGMPMPKPIFADDKLSYIILKACAFEPDERYQHASDLKQDLMDYKQGKFDIPKGKKSKHKSHSSQPQKPKKIFKFRYVVAVVLVAGIATAGGYYFMSNRLETSAKLFDYETTDGGIIINDYFGKSQSVIIPSKIDSLPVVEIGNSAFEGSDVVSVVVPSSVIEIHRNAFKNCQQLESITLNENLVSLQEDCFDNCYKLKSIDLPDSLESFDENSFDYCSMLTSVNFSENNSNYCSVDGVVFTKDMSTLVYYPQGKKSEEFSVPNTVTTIFEYAFEGNENLKTLTIPSSVQTIQDGAFMSCTSLESITIENDDATLGDNILSESKNAVLYCNKDSEAMQYAMDNSIVYNIGEGNVEYLYEKASDDDGEYIILSKYFGNDESVNIPKTIDNITVKAIGEQAFCGNQSIKSVVVPENLENIYIDAFKDCINLENIVLPSTLEFIDQGVFMNDTSLRDITIPQLVSDIYDYTFYNCTALKSINIGENVKYLYGDNIFTNCKDLTIRCSKDSPAQEYATSHSITYESI